MNSSNLVSVALSIQLASITTLLLLVLGTPLAWWLAKTQSRIKPIVEAVTALPLVLPPTVLGFYLLIVFSPTSPLGSAFVALTGETLTFSFRGLVFASLIYSLPFMVQPLQVAFEGLDRELLESARVLGANAWHCFTRVVVPVSFRGFLTASVLCFAHTIGEFGVVLMIGGNIPAKTRVVSIAIYEHVETLSYAQAHQLSLGLLIFCFVVLVAVYVLNRRMPIQVVHRA